MKKTIFTTSWDDGNKLDLKVLELLDKYNLKGTFYIPKQYILKTLSDKDILLIDRTQEIGAHTLTHPDLDKLDLPLLEKEIVGSKKYLEDLLNHEVKMFGYPKGRYNKDAKQESIKAGFIGVRGLKKGDGFDFDCFEMPVSLQIYPFPLRRRSANKIHWSRFLFQPLINNYWIVKKYNLPLKSFLSWNNLARSYFSAVVKKGGIFHLWGHSWEIEKYKMWNQLEELFKFIYNKSNVLPLTNSQIIEYANNNIK